MTRPTLDLWLNGARVGRLACPQPMAPRAWILGVAALQVTVEAGQVTARLRAHVTGAAEPQLVELGGAAVVHAALVAPGAAPPALPAHAAPALEGAAARLSVWLDGALVGAAVLAPSALSAKPAPRAFGHVFCRWLSAGGLEPGFDLTDFLSLPPGVKYERLVSRPLQVGQMVSYGFTTWPRTRTRERPAPGTRDGRP